jgi:hypothetical protein
MPLPLPGRTASALMLALSSAMLLTVFQSQSIAAMRSIPKLPQILGDAAMGAELFWARTIEVRGTDLLDPLQLIASAGLPDTLRTWRTAELLDARQRLATVPGVEQVRVDVRPPWTLILSIREYPPVAWSEQNGRRHLVLADGAMIDASRLSRRPDHLPYLIAPAPTSLSDPATVQSLRTTRALLMSGIDWVDDLERVRPGPGGTLSVWLRASPDLEIRLPAGTPPSRATLLGEMLRITEDNPASVIDFRFDEQVVVRRRR